MRDTKQDPRPSKFGTALPTTTVEGHPRDFTSGIQTHATATIQIFLYALFKASLENGRRSQLPPDEKFDVGRYHFLAF
jgi:hypothetical protein